MRRVVAVARCSRAVVLVARWVVLVGRSQPSDSDEARARRLEQRARVPGLYR